MQKSGARLKTVLRVKKHQERMAQQELTVIQDTHVKEVEALANLSSRQEAALGEAGTTKKARATDLQVHRAFIQKLNRDIKQQGTRVHEIEEQENDKREELTGKSQSRQMVEQLGERWEQAQAKELDRKEQQLIDALANRQMKVL
jgi:flagellar export protein FliJ